MPNLYRKGDWWKNLSLLPKCLEKQIDSWHRNKRWFTFQKSLIHHPKRCVLIKYNFNDHCLSMIWEMSPQKWIRMSFEDTVRYSGRCQTSRVFDLVNVGVLLKLVNPETKKTSLSTYSFQRKSCIWTKKISSKIPTWKNAQNWRYKVSQLHVTHLPSRYSDPPCLHL